MSAALQKLIAELLEYEDLHEDTRLLIGLALQAQQTGTMPGFSPPTDKKKPKARRQKFPRLPRTLAMLDQFRLAEAVRHTAQVLRRLNARKLTRETDRHMTRKIKLANVLLESVTTPAPRRIKAAGAD